MLLAVYVREDLRDRYFLPLTNVSSHFDGCNSKFSFSRALSCVVGLLDRSCHDESRDSTIYLSSVGFVKSNVRDKPLIHPSRGSDVEDVFNQTREEVTGITAEINTECRDILVRGFWTRNIYCIVDVRTCDVYQPYYLYRNLSVIIKSEKTEKN